MSEQLLVIGLGIGDDADAAWFLSGLALADPDAPVVYTYGVTSTTGYVTSSSAVSHVLATVTTDGSQ
jgi:hypothetical protein